jgi:hypothetical protein
MAYFIPTKSGSKGPFGTDVLERLVAEGKIPPGFPVICAETGRRLPVEEAIDDSLALPVDADLETDLVPPADAGAAAPAGEETTPPRPVRGGPVRKSMLRPSLRRPLPVGGGRGPGHPPAPARPAAPGDGLVARAAVPARTRFHHRTVGSVAAVKSPATPSALAASGIILFLLVLLHSAVKRGARGWELIGGAIGGAAVLLMFSAALAATITTLVGWKGNRFAGILIGTSLFCGLGSFGVLSGARRDGDAGPEAGVEPSPPISFRADLYEVTPAPGWGRSAIPAIASADIQLAHLGSQSIFMVIVIEKRDFEEVPALDAFARECRENFLKATLGSQLIWGPEAVSGKGLPGIRCGISKVEKGLRLEGIQAILSGRNAFLQVYAIGPVSGIAARRGDIDRMLASIRER